MNKKIYPNINETLYHEKLTNGLNVYLLPKPGFHKTYVTISTPLGSNVTAFNYNNKDYEIPDGVAHFLEHKLFDRNGKDISEDFAINSAQVNAYTMNNRTTYLFSCTEHLNDNIATLLNFVLFPTFTEKGIKKEIGIISQEIKMYEDDPNTQIYMGTLKNMFEKHPVRNDILGSIESINRIDKATLEIVHEAFYDPNNMVMFITGNMDVEDTLAFIKSQVTQEKSKNNIVIHNLINEPSKVCKVHQQSTYDILQPNCLLGIKQDATDLASVNMMKKELTYSILFDIILGKSSDNYQMLIQKKLINDTFGMDITFEDSYGYILVGSNTDYPEAFFKTLKDIFLNLTDNKIKEADFARTKKQVIGGFITALNNLEYIANQFTKYHFLDASLFEILEITKSITIEDVEEAKESFMNEESYTSFTIFPKK